MYLRFKGQGKQGGKEGKSWQERSGLARTTIKYLLHISCFDQKVSTEVSFS